jgi:diguanylate cyclase (GGDEF)-like protein
MAITNHVAVSLETARAAQLEVAVESARQQRDLAELLRTSMAAVSTTLDPEEVLRRLLDVVAGALPGDMSCLLRRHDDRFSVLAVGGAAVDSAGPFEVAGGLAALAGRRIPVVGAVADGEPVPLPSVLPGARSWVAVPLAARGEPIGLLLVASAAAHAYTDAHLQIAAALVGHGMTAYDNAFLFAQVNQLATVDSLTGVATRRQLLELAGRMFDAPSAGPITAIMLDIDHFKLVNDTFGHLVGDAVIAEVARRLRAAVRDDDLIGRYGGEEFAVVLAGRPGSDAELADRMRTAVASTSVDTAAGPIRVTVSIGIAERHPDDAELGALLGRADQALYRAKQAGRNRVVAA